MLGSFLLGRWSWDMSVVFLWLLRFFAVVWSVFWGFLASRFAFDWEVFGIDSCIFRRSDCL